MTAARCSMLAGYFGLLGLWLAWSTVLAPARHAPSVLTAGLSVLPLLIPLRGMLDEHRGSLLWLGLISLFYFIHGVAEFTDISQRIPAVLEIGLSLCLFAGSVARLRAEPNG